MLLPYYRLQKTQEDKEFFFSHKGYFNFWGKYLMLNLGYNTFRPIVNRPNTRFHGVATKEQEKNFNSSITEHCREHKPEEMFKDFPELENIRFKYI